MLAQHFGLGLFADLSIHFGTLLKKLLFLGRTLLLRLWVLGTHVRKRLERLGEQPGQLEADKLVLVQDAGGRGLGGLPGEGCYLGWLAGWLAAWLAGWLVSW